MLLENKKPWFVVKDNEELEDCFKSKSKKILNKNAFVEIKQEDYNDIKKFLDKYHNLSDNDWIDIAEKTYKSFFITCVNFWNKGWCVNQIHEEIKLSNDTIRKYLISAQKLGMCDYNTSEARSRWRKYYEQCKQ